MGTRHLAAPVGRAFLWNDNKSGDLIKVPAGREIERITREPDRGRLDSSRLRSTRVDSTARQIKPIKPLAPRQVLLPVDLSGRRSINLFRLIVFSTISFNARALNFLRDVPSFFLSASRYSGLEVELRDLLPGQRIGNTRFHLLFSPNGIYI